jgi:hypothetical protein
MIENNTNMSPNIRVQSKDKLLSEFSFYYWKLSNATIKIHK